MSKSVLCDTCIYHLGRYCTLYNLPDLHDIRYCDKYQRREVVK